MVQPEADCITGKAYSGSPQCHCGQVVPTQSGDTNGMVPPPGGLQPDLQEMAQAGGRPFCDQVQSQTSQVCVPGSGSTSLESRCSKRPLAKSGRICLSPGGSSREGGLQVVGSRIPQSHSNCSRMAKHAMDLGSGQHVGTNSSLPKVGNLLTQPFNQCPHRDLHSLNLHAWLLGPLPSNKQASLAKWQRELKLLRDAQPEPSMNQSGPFLSDGVRNIRWTSGLLL